MKIHGWALHKTRKTLPSWLKQALEQAQRDAGDEEHAAVVLAEVSQGREARHLVVLDFDVWRELVGAAAAKEGAEA